MKYLTFLAAVVAVSGFSAALAHEGIDNKANFIPIQGTIAGLSGVVNGVEARDIKNAGNFVPVEGTIAGLAGVANGIEGRDLKNSANFVPIQATLAALSEVTNDISTGNEEVEKKSKELKQKHHWHRGHNDANVIPIQASLLLAAGVVNHIEKREPLLEGLKAPVGNQDLLKAVRRFAAEHDEEMAKRSIISHDGRGQRPRPRGEGEGEGGMCNVGKLSCCNQVIEDETKKETLAGLAGISDVLSGNVGLNCDSIPVLGATIQNQCKVTPVCCQNVTQDGLVNFGCISLPIN